MRTSEIFRGLSRELWSASGGKKAVPLLAFSPTKSRAARQPTRDLGVDDVGCDIASTHGEHHAESRIGHPSDACGRERLGIGLSRPALNFKVHFRGLSVRGRDNLKDPSGCKRGGALSRFFLNAMASSRMSVWASF